MTWGNRKDGQEMTRQRAHRRMGMEVAELGGEETHAKCEELPRKDNVG